MDGFTAFLKSPPPRRDFANHQPSTVLEKCGKSAQAGASGLQARIGSARLLPPLLDHADQSFLRRRGDQRAVAGEELAAREAKEAAEAASTGVTAT